MHQYLTAFKAFLSQDLVNLSLKHSIYVSYRDIYLAHITHGMS